MADINGNEFDNELEGTDQADVINGFGGDDDINGNEGDDSLYGGDGRDYLEGQQGDDFIDGGGGDRDRAAYNDDDDGANQGIVANLASGTVIDSYGDTDTLVNVERIRGSNFDDVISAEGVDFEVGLDGENGDDEITGGNANSDWLQGEEGDDTLDGGPGDDDAAAYDEEHGTQGIVADVAAGTVQDPHGDTDTIINIERIIGSRFNDDITAEGVDFRTDLEGGPGNDNIDGGSNSDDIQGGAGDDILRGGGAGDFFEPGSGTDQIYGGMGGLNDWWDTVSYYRDDDNDEDLNDGEDGIIVTFTNEEDGTIIDWDGDTDTFQQIDTVRGTRYDDSFTGSDGRQVFQPMGGTDTIDGGEDGDDRDTVDYRPYNWEEESNTGITASLADGTVIDPDGNTDTVINIEEVYGTDQADTFIGNDERNWFEDGSEDGDPDPGNDNDTMDGGAGNDGFLVNWGDDTIDGGDGDEDVLAFRNSFDDWTFTSTGDNSFTMTGAMGTKTVSNVEYVEFWEDDGGWIAVDALRAGASNGDDTLGDPTSTEDQFLNGLDGNDTLNGGLGNDELRGDAGNDVLISNGGDDRLEGGDGDDILEANVRDGEFVYFVPGNGNDTMIGRVFEGDDDDRQFQGVGYWNLDFGIEFDLTTGTTVDRETGGEIKSDTHTGLTKIDATNFDDILIGGNPDTDWYESFTGNAGNDNIAGGSGYDRVEYYWEDGDNGVTVNLADGMATDTFGDKDTLSGIEGVVGSRYDDTLIGANGFNDFIGYQGNDTIDGGEGMYDRARYDRDKDRGGSNGINANLITGIIIDGFGDTDTVTNIESVRGTDFADVFIANDGFVQFQAGDGDDTLTGGAGRNQLQAGDGDDVVNALGGNDEIFYTSGADVIDGGDGVDTLNAGYDQADLTFTSTADGFMLGDASVSNVEFIQFDDGILTVAQLESGATVGDDEVTMTEGGTVETAGGDDMVTGSSENDVISTGAGDDVVNAGDGDDDILDAFGDNDLSGGEGNDTITTYSGQSNLNGGGGSDVLIGGIGKDVIDGGDGEDTIFGDVVQSLGDNDRINGGTGNDVMTGGMGVDTFVFATSDGDDRIEDFASGLDLIELSGFALADGAAALAAVTDDVGGTAVFSAEGTTITFNGLTAADLTADDFVLA